MKWPTVLPRDTTAGYTPVRQTSTDNSLLQAMAEHSASQAPRSSKYAARYATDPSDDDSSGSSGSDMDLEAGRPLFKFVAGPAAAANQRRMRPFLSRRTARTVALCILALVSVLITYHFILPEDFATRIYRIEPEEDPPKWNVNDDYPEGYNSSDLAGPESEAYAIASDQTHLLVPVRPLTTPSPRLLLPMESRPPLDLLTHFYVTGQLPVAVRSHTQPPIDLVYMFVNATSQWFETAKDAKVNEEDIQSLKGKFRHWRDNGELRGAVRSGAMSLGKHAGAVHLVSAAFDVPEGAELPPEAQALVEDGTVPNGTRWRMGQVPAWLNVDNKANLRTHFHPDLFRLARDNDGKLPPGLDELDEEDWQRKALPTFNSFAIEAGVGMIEGLSDTFIMSNDDMFNLQIMSPTDYHHPVLGAVHRLAPGLTVEPKIDPKLLDNSGEWGGLQHAAYLIAQRFTGRKRMYEHHVPKAMSRSLTHEATVMFAETFAKSTTRSFRESRRGVGDIEMTWLVTQLQIERWREALLWSFIVARVGGPSGKWGDGARDELRRVFGLEEGNEGDVVVVETDRRETIVDVPNLDRHGGWDDPKNSFYRWSSFDGHLPPDPEVVKERKCYFSIMQCLPRNFFQHSTEFDADELFTAFAFEKPSCGDCLINALVTASGIRGLSAFLPAEDAVYYPAKEAPAGMWQRSEPMLPLTPTWRGANFSMEANVRRGQDVWEGAPERPDGGVSLRNFSVKLLSRYAYVFGTANVKFAMVTSVLGLHKTLKEVDADEKISMLCINDDQPDHAREGMRLSLGHWMEAEFGGDNGFVRWERPGWPWV
ncbi:hypothetical protein Q8F55_009017 [Vanrija albida]|uniref:Stealth protein CR3 conserved region 3 domain-containing protein n=1 Tax=Vanrija albida TaxID=181172 RepID=A0ABR3PSG6_9TREE